jgi:tight adherence protein C
MNTVQLLALGATALGIGTVGYALSAVARREARINERMLRVQRSLGVDQVVAPRRPLQTVAVEALASLGRFLARSGVLSAKTTSELEQTLLAAGFRGGGAIAVFVGAKIVMLLGGLTLALGLVWLTGVRQPLASFLVVAATVVGLLAPDIIARRLRANYLRELESGLSDALDLMVICGEAGLPLEAAIERTAREMQNSNRAVATELGLCASELRILSDRRAALINMAERTGLGPVRRVTMALAQSMQYGTPLTQVLRTLAAEMRADQLVRFEARAARLPVLLTLPMICCILPTLFLVVGGPAMLKVMALW